MCRSRRQKTFVVGWMAFWRRASARKMGFRMEPGRVWSWAASAGFTVARSWPVWASRIIAVAGVFLEGGLESGLDLGC